MFNNLFRFFKKFGKKELEELSSKDMAKERLHLVLMQDRANVSADFLDMMKQEIIDVIKKYIDVDENDIDVRLTNKMNEDGTTGAPALYANIPIAGIKAEIKDTSSNVVVENDVKNDGKENNKDNEEPDKEKVEVIEEQADNNEDKKVEDKSAEKVVEEKDDEKTENENIEKKQEKSKDKEKKQKRDNSKKEESEKDENQSKEENTENQVEEVKEEADNKDETSDAE